MDEFLTVAEVAELLKLNQQTIRNWIDRGELSALHAGRRVRIRRQDLEQLLEDASIRSKGEHATDKAAASAPEDRTADATLPPELWERLGNAATALGHAIPTAQRTAIAEALAELGDAAHQLANALRDEPS